MKQISQKAGLTLIELLISISTIAVISTIISQVFLTTIRVNRKTVTLQDLQQQGNFAVDVIQRMVRNSYGITSTCEEGATSAQSLVFVNPDTRESAIGCFSDGSSARIASMSADNSTLIYLTGSNVTLSASGGDTCADSTLTFSCNEVGNTSPISISFTLYAKGAGVNPDAPDSATFVTSVRPRNIK